MSELDFISHIKNAGTSLEAGLVGIGDDAAVIPANLRGFAVTTDMIIEGRHFDLSIHSLEQIGRKAMAVNLSDLAAMGASPRYALVSLAIPERLGADRVKNLWAGIQKMADEFNVIIIGGDTNSWSQGLVINICLLGEPPEGGCVLRGGARPGDGIFVTGPLGGTYESGHHLMFEPKVRLASQILRTARPTSMIDLSDGLATDLGHLCAASGVGANLTRQAIPVSPRVDLNLPAERRLGRALTDGEDFELLLTLSPESIPRVEASTPIIKIGTVSSEPGIRVDGVHLVMKGFEHRFGLSHQLPDLVIGKQR
jgi:thiamine-monophosphate kinase